MGTHYEISRKNGNWITRNGYGSGNGSTADRTVKEIKKSLNKTWYMGVEWGWDGVSMDTPPPSLFPVVDIVVCGYNIFVYRMSHTAWRHRWRIAIPGVSISAPLWRVFPVKVKRHQWNKMSIGGEVVYAVQILKVSPVTVEIVD